MNRKKSRRGAHRPTNPAEANDGLGNEEAGPSRPGVILFGLILLGLAIRMAYWSPFLGYDDTAYMEYASQLARGEAPAANLGSSRLAFVGYLALSMRLFGESTWTCSSACLLAFVISALAIYGLAGALAGIRAALVSVFLYVFLPIDVVNSTLVLPDGLAAAFLVASCLPYLRAVRAEDRRRRLLWGLAAGAVLGIAVSVKETSLVMALAFLLHAFATVQGKARAVALVLAMALGGAAVMGLDAVLQGLWSGDPGRRLLVIPLDTRLWSEANPLTVPKALSYLVQGSNSWGPYGLHAYLVLLGLVLGLSRRNRAMLLPVLGCGVLALYLSVGSMNPMSYALVPQTPRYLLPVLLLGLAFTGGELQEAASKLRLGRGAMGIATVVVVAVSLWAARLEPRWGMGQVAEHLARIPLDERGGLAITADLVARQPLEYRRFVEGYMVIDERKIAADGDLANLLGNRGLVVPDFEPYQAMSDRLLHHPHLRFRAETWRGPAWPPYYRLIPSRSTRPIAKVWRIEDRPPGGGR